MLSGRIEEAWAAAEQLRQQTADLPSAGAQLLSAAIAGHAALAAGRLHTACSLLEPVVTLLSAAGELTSSAGEANGLEYRNRMPHTVALAARGFPMRPPPRLPRWSGRDIPLTGAWTTSLEIARAWVAACQGAGQ